MCNNILIQRCFFVIITEEEILDEERRLLHVALTRARVSCTVSCSALDAYGQSSPPTRFLNDIPSRYHFNNRTTVLEKQCFTNVC
jgi:superfamily I DNA/RNA helicase